MKNSKKNLTESKQLKKKVSEKIMFNTVDNPVDLIQENEADVTIDDPEALGEDLSQDLDDNRDLKQKVYPLDFSEKEFDVLGLEMDEASDEISLEDGENFPDESLVELIPGNEADVTKDDLEALGPQDLSQDMGDDEDLKHRVYPLDFSGNDLDIPGAEMDDASEETGSEDEENNSYSIGGDAHNKLEETNYI